VLPSVSPRLSLLLAAALGLASCAIADRISGVSDAKALQGTGIAAEATIQKIWDTGITVNQDPVIGMEVEVQPSEGQAWRATIPKSLISRLDIPRFQPGQRVSVRYDPHDTSRVALDMYHYK
jgi:hypothetical protein